MSMKIHAISKILFVILLYKWAPVAAQDGGKSDLTACSTSELECVNDVWQQFITVSTFFPTRLDRNSYFCLKMQNIIRCLKNSTRECLKYKPVDSFRGNASLLANHACVDSWPMYHYITHNSRCLKVANWHFIGACLSKFNYENKPTRNMCVSYSVLRNCIINVVNSFCSNVFDSERVMGAMMKIGDQYFISICKDYPDIVIARALSTYASYFCLFSSILAVMLPK